jgi:glucan phosphoethanolaminetransferase (alkaline phosphatase superfamily)
MDNLTLSNVTNTDNIENNNNIDPKIIIIVIFFGFFFLLAIIQICCNCFLRYCYKKKNIIFPLYRDHFEIVNYQLNEVVANDSGYESL